MKDNYIMLNGQRYELSQEEITKLTKQHTNDPFKRLSGGTYYRIYEGDTVAWVSENNTFEDRNRYNAANYCTDESLMKQRALHETLSRLLWRYSMQHNGRLIDFYPTSDHCKDKYFIIYDNFGYKFDIGEAAYSKIDGTIYFHEESTARDAIEEIVKPFMQEHPDFIW